VRLLLPARSLQHRAIFAFLAVNSCMTHCAFTDNMSLFCLKLFKSVDPARKRTKRQHTLSNLVQTLLNH
jgi:hypothetical protein